MTLIERRALYHLLRMNWLKEPTLLVEPWQVENYRELSIPQLFNRLEKFDIHLDRTSFVIYADEADSPEELTDHLVADRSFNPTFEDQVFLIVFELWRQLMPDKPSLSIICYELDHQIYLFDHQMLKDQIPLQESLAQFSEILHSNVDQGLSPKEVIQLISNHCANDIETFLYDFISEQIEDGNDAYAYDLIEEYSPYFFDNKWFVLLKLRLLGSLNSQTSQRLIEQIFDEYLDDQDLEYNFELLYVLSEMKNRPLFETLLRSTFSLIKTEENLQDLLFILIEYFDRIDQKSKSDSLKNLLEQRKDNLLVKINNQNDPDLNYLKSFFS
ncbi:MAG: hypothetical protein Q8K60_02035 [Parachlamydiaceae bacterium]|nr:hypothetical protein [Parachlamydiaceae bacterium]